MKTIDLNGQWNMKALSREEWIDANVPGSVFQDLFAAGEAPDPYYRDNEDKVAYLFKEDYEYKRDFSVSADILAHDIVELCCEGLDTLTTIHINGKKVADTDNMHRTYSFRVKDILQEGVNSIHILFKSPVKYAERRHVEANDFEIMQAEGPMNRTKGREHIRKAQCMFGWDWGISLPDSGIWRDIYLECFDEARINYVQILQDHNDGYADLQIKSEIECWGEKSFEICAEVKSPNGEEFSVSGKVNAGETDWTADIRVPNPQLWWPNGYGDQPLYQVDVSIKEGDRVFDHNQNQIGLRTITLRREKDEHGRSYEFVINGVPIFMKGSNLVIEDAMLGRCSKERTEKMIKDCAEANFNIIRVWGGAVYPSDSFYGACDKYGIVLFHDFMFSGLPPVDEEFLETVRCEIRDNVRRARNHACLGLWNGNNEMDMVIHLCTSDDYAPIRKAYGLTEMDEKAKLRMTDDFKKIFCEEIPGLLSELDPKTSYVRSSPIGENLFEAPLTENNPMGDAHYYVHSDSFLPGAPASPFKRIRSKQFRFISEGGHQSYPNIKTIHSFTLPEDRAPYSKVMLNHQKSDHGNEIIEGYMSSEYKIPEDFEQYVYLSQVLAGDIQRSIAEHVRRSQGYTMGLITWMLNDCWPCVSWAGLDYFGRWKAQQYFTKRFYSPLLLSALDEDKALDLWVTNETSKEIDGHVVWKLCSNKSEVAKQGGVDTKVKSGKSEMAVHLDFADFISEENKSEYYVEFALSVDNTTVSRGTSLFVKPTEFKLEPPEIALDVKEDLNKFIITVTSAAFAKFVGLDLSEADCIFSDNYFDLSAGEERKLEVEKSSLSENLTLSQFEQQLKAVSVYDVK